jgi:hypothetical protein
MNFLREIIMTYNSSSQKNKVPKTELTNQQQAGVISLQEWTNNQIQSTVDNAQPKSQNIPLSNQWDSDWILMTPVLAGDGITVLAVYQTWKITIGNINQKWLSKFQAEIICKNGIDGGDDNKDFQIESYGYFNKFLGWEITDLETNPTSDIKTVSLIASLMITRHIKSFPVFYYLPNFYAKLLFKYVDKTNRD